MATSERTMSEIMSEMGRRGAQAQKKNVSKKDLSKWGKAGAKKRAANRKEKG